MKYSVTDQQLDAMISDEDLNEISHSLPKWEQVAIQLGLDQHQIRDIQHSFGIRGKLVLTAWKNRQGRQATYRKLVEVLDKLYEVECARQVCHLIRDYGECRNILIALLGFVLYMCICNMYPPVQMKKKNSFLLTGVTVYFIVRIFCRSQ